jgi:hypothetical protein
VILLDIICRARIHDSAEAREQGCVCPVAFGVPYRPARSAPQRRYISGRLQNMLGPRLRTVTEPDEIAVDRAVGGDQSLRLAVIERGAAIAKLDRFGLSASEIAVRLGTTQRTVERWRARNRRQAEAS